MSRVDVAAPGGDYNRGTGTRQDAILGALIKEMHPGWSPGAIKAAVQRTAQHLDCPPDWEPLSSSDERERCYGDGGRTSFFGHGLVDASAAALE